MYHYHIIIIIINLIDIFITVQFASKTQMGP